MEFVEINGFENYGISLDGEVINFRTGRLVAKEVNNGYERVRLWRDGKQHNKKVHRLLADAYLEPVDGKAYINHINGNKLDNSLDNLEWCTLKENMEHAFRTGLNHAHPNPNAGRTRRPVKIIETGNEYSSLTECARSIGGNPNKIQDCLSGRQHSHRGYHFEDI